MENANPYQSPQSEITPPAPEGVDTTNPFDPSGRFTRLSYLAWGMLMTVALYVAGLIVAVVLGVSASALSESALSDVESAAGIGAIVVMLAFAIGFSVISILFAIRRLHDMNASGWWSATMLLPYLNVIPFLVLIFASGHIGTNRFGPPRPTPTWEQVVGIIGAIILGLFAAILVISIAVGIFVATQQA